MTMNIFRNMPDTVQSAGRIPLNTTSIFHSESKEKIPPKKKGHDKKNIHLVISVHIKPEKYIEPSIYYSYITRSMSLFHDCVT